MYGTAVVAELDDFDDKARGFESWPRRRSRRTYFAGLIVFLVRGVYRAERWCVR